MYVCVQWSDVGPVYVGMWRMHVLHTRPRHDALHGPRGIFVLFVFILYSTALTHHVSAFLVLLHCDDVLTWFCCDVIVCIIP